MDIQLVVLRSLHILFGAFWVGTDAFVTFLLLPRLRSLGRDIEQPVTVLLMRILPPALMVSSLIAVVSGIWVTGLTRGWNLDWVSASGSGWVMSAGSVGTFLALVVGFGIIPPLTMRMNKLARAFEGRAPTDEESRQIESLTGRITVLARANSALLIVVVVTMAVARFV
ncbi:MAG: hypothetical protein HYX92_11500 [Chloroflexi bacterium]|nr:hypothetical protein [Chloroflexota bacterium]